MTETALIFNVIKIYRILKAIKFMEKKQRILITSKIKVITIDLLKKDQ